MGNQSICCRAHPKLQSQQPLQTRYLPNIRQPQNIEAQYESQKYIDEISYTHLKLRPVTEDQMKNPLHRNLVAIVWQNPKNKLIIGKGTGMLISRNLVLTSAHNLYDKLERLEKHFIKIYPGISGKLIKHFTIEDFYVPPQFQNDKTLRSFRYDYALIKLDKQVSASGFLELKPQFNNWDVELGIYGYPGKKYKNSGDNNIETVSQWGISTKNAVIDIRDEIGEILHCISTEPGESGSPIIQLVKNKKGSIIGIHKGCKQATINDKVQEVNSGKLLSKEILHNLKQQAQRMNGEMFLTADQQMKRSQAEKWKEKAKELHDKKDYQKAIRYYRNAIRHGLKDTWIYCHLGLSMKAAGNTSQALGYYSLAIKIDKTCYKAYHQIGNVLSQKDSKQAEAILYYQAAININPQYAEAYYNLGLILLKTENYGLAINNFRQVLKYQPKNAQAINALAKSLFLNDQMEQSIKQFKKAMQVAEKSYTNPYYDIRQPLVKLNRIPEARQYLQKGLKINPKDKDMLAQLERLRSLK